MVIRMIVFVALVGALCAGCAFSVRGQYALLNANHQITKDQTYDASLRSHIAQLPKGKQVSGRHCESAILGLIPLPPSFHIMPDPDRALASALDEAGKPYDSIADAEVVHTQYLYMPIGRTICSKVTGTAAQDRPYQGAVTRTMPTSRGRASERP
jgi:hypothetical protein